MFYSLLAIIFIILLFFSVSLQRVFFHENARKLKQRARQHELGATELYKVASHGENLHLLLWILIVISASFSSLFLSRLLEFWLGFVLILLIVWVSFVWLPNSRVSQLEIAMTGWTAPVLAWLLNFLRKPLAFIVKLSSNKRISFDTGLYTSADLVNLLMAQKEQEDNQIDPRSLDMAISALSFENKHIEDMMIPRRNLKLVKESDKISPVLVDDLHSSGMSRFVVTSDKSDEIVGTIKLSDLIDLKKTGSVRDSMNNKVFYVHEDSGLRQVLDVFLKTHEHFFVVVNKFEDFVGVVSIEDVIKEIVGSVVSDFDDYHDLSAVAKSQAVASHIAREATGSEPEPEDEITVVE